MTRRGLKTAVTGIALAMATFLWLPGATAATTGTIAVGHPATLLPGGITEVAFKYHANCNMSNPVFAATQGKDAWVIDLGLYTNLTLSSTSLGNTHSLSFMFYNSSCSLFGANYFGHLVTQTSWSAPVPATSRWLVVNAYRGAKIDLTYTLS